MRSNGRKSQNCVAGCAPSVLETRRGYVGVATITGTVMSKDMNRKTLERKTPAQQAKQAERTVTQLH